MRYYKKILVSSGIWREKYQDENGEVVDENNTVCGKYAIKKSLYLAQYTRLPKQKTPRRNEGF